MEKKVWGWKVVTRFCNKTTGQRWLLEGKAIKAYPRLIERVLSVPPLCSFISHVIGCNTIEMSNSSKCSRLFDSHSSGARKLFSISNYFATSTATVEECPGLHQNPHSENIWRKSHSLSRTDQSRTKNKAGLAVAFVCKAVTIYYVYLQARSPGGYILIWATLCFLIGTFFIRMLRLRLTKILSRH